MSDTTTQDITLGARRALKTAGCANIAIAAAHVIGLIWAWLRRLPLLRAGLASIAAIYLWRATVYGGLGAVRDGDGAQITFAAIALLIGLSYAYGALAHPRQTPARGRPRRTGDQAGPDQQRELRGDPAVAHHAPDRA